jgi:hypothetical protein
MVLASMPRRTASWRRLAGTASEQEPDAYGISIWQNMIGKLEENVREITGFPPGAFLYSSVQCTYEVFAETGALQHSQTYL